MADHPIRWVDETVTVAGTALHLRTGGSGAPLLILHHDIGCPDRPALHEALAARFSVLAPAHPGYDQSARPAWLRNVRDIAVIYQALLAERGLTGVTCVGLGFGGWIAAEMATMAPAQFRRLVLVGAMGIKPERGDIMDQALVSYIEYIRAGFHDPAALDRAYGTELPTPLLERWDVNRETTFRIAWRPYMFNPSLPHLLGDVRSPTLVVWGADDRVVPLECGERYAKALPAAKLVVIEKAGHLVDMERPEDVARAVIDFAGA
jgi:pimeloyl-ACP methyl ester carboxylesterase